MLRRGPSVRERTSDYRRTSRGAIGELYSRPTALLVRNRWAETRSCLVRGNLSISSPREAATSPDTRGCAEVGGRNQADARPHPGTRKERQTQSHEPPLDSHDCRTLPTTIVSASRLVPTIRDPSSHPTRSSPLPSRGKGAPTDGRRTHAKPRTQNAPRTRRRPHLTYSSGVTTRQNDTKRKKHLHGNRPCPSLRAGCSRRRRRHAPRLVPSACSVGL